MRHLLLTLLLLSGIAQAQNVINFSTNVSQADGSATPTLTWSTQPVATSCTASGSWTGTKSPSGTEIQPATLTSKTYNLTCTWAANTTATVIWVPPTTNTDGSTLTDLASTLIRYGRDKTAAQALDLSQSVPVPARTFVFNGLAAGVWSFEAIAVNAAGKQSEPTARASKTILGTATASQSVGVTVNPVPSRPTGLTVQ